MMRTLNIVLMAVMVSAQPTVVQAADGTKKAASKPRDSKKKTDENVVQIGGMSIIGNRELPKSLYIVPWKDSDVDSETDLSRDLLNERAEVVDQDEFKRQLNYYDLSK
jgi:hypothetical protein